MYDQDDCLPISWSLFVPVTFLPQSHTWLQDIPSAFYCAVEQQLTMLEKEPKQNNKPL